MTGPRATTVNMIRTIVYLLGCETANHVNFMQHMLVYTHRAIFSSLEGDIAEVSKIFISGN